MKKKSVLLVLSSLLLFSFILLSKYEDRPAIRNLDFAVTVKVQEKIDRSAHLRAASLVGNVMEGSTFFASPVFTSIIVLLLAAVAWKKWHWRAFIVPFAFIVIVLIEFYAKSIVHHPSPPFSMIKNPTTVFPANYVNEQFSYPSGHAARAVFLAFITYFLMKKRLIVGFGLGLYVFLVSISRIYLGHHWFSDVIGGLALGSAMGVLTWVILATYNTKTMSD